MAEVNLPESWILSTIDEVVLNTNGARKPISLSLRAEIQGPYPYYGATGQIDSLNYFTHEGEHILIGEDGANLLSKSKDLAFIVNGQFWVNNHAHAVKCLAGVPAKYIASYINSLDLTPYVTGSAQPKLTKGNLDKIPVPLPPLAEQKVIAEKLDTLLAQVDNTKARLERIPEILKRFRQSVLAAAVSGKLTEEWRRGNAFKEDAVLLGSLISESSVGLVRASGEQYEDSAGRQQYVKMNNIDNFWGHNTDNLKYVDASEEEVSKYGLQKGDWLFNTRNSIELVGKSCVWKGEEGLLYNNNILRVKFHDKVLADYVELFIKSPKGQQLLTTIKSGTTNVAAIYQKQLFQLPIDITELEEQTEIVRRVEELFAFADRIEQNAQAALSRVSNLTQSILAKAFRGELTADWRAANPELISGENSAEALLARIKAERAKLNQTKKGRGKSVEN